MGEYDQRLGGLEEVDEEQGRYRHPSGQELGIVVGERAGAFEIHEYEGPIVGDYPGPSFLDLSVWDCLPPEHSAP